MENDSKENKYTGVVYCLTNKINGKKYIGQALSYIIDHGKIIKHGLEGRFKEHCQYAMNESGKNRNYKLYPAMKEFGIENFDKEILAICDIETLNIVEMFYIKKFNSVNDGYNITYQGTARLSEEDNLKRISKTRETMLQRWKDPEYINKTVPANLQAVMKRANEGTLRKTNKDLPANIYKSDNGYDIRVMRNGKLKITSVEGINLSDDEKLQLAIKKRDEILYNMENDIDDSLHKKTDHNDSELPKGIVKFKARGNEGYKVIVRYKGKRKEQNFTDGSLTMEEKLELAKKALADMNANKIELINKPIEDRLDHNNNILPNNIVLVKKNNESIGYSINYKNERKGFCTKEKTMDEKLELAKQHLIQIMGNPQAIS